MVFGENETGYGPSDPLGRCQPCGFFRGSLLQNRGATSGFMRLSKCAAGILVLVLFAIVGFAVWPQRKEPEYHGRKLSALLLEMVGSGSESSRDSPLGKAIVEIGTNGIPFYLDCDLLFKRAGG